MNKTALGQAIQRALYAGLIPLAATPAAALAADQAAATTTASDTSTAQLGKIEVTGTRIKRTDVETAQPVSIITQSQIKASGLTSIGDVLQQVSSFGAALNTQFNNGGSGATFLNLRNLGPNRLLVLLNGSRVDAGIGGQVDLNNIPSAIIDHVEILQDGASAIYGSDAISGVVNIITVKNYNGAEANAFVGEFDGKPDGGVWDGKTQSYDFTIGTSGDKSAVVMNIAYVNQSPMFAGNRTISKEPLVGGGNPAGSSGAAGGRFVVLGIGNQTKGALNNPGCFSSTSSTVHTVCNLTQVTPGNTATGQTISSLRGFTPADRFNYAPLNYLVTPNERTSLFAQAHYDLADNLTFNTMTIYNNRVSQQQLAPSPLFLGAGGASFSNGQAISISALNPYNPFGKGLIGNSVTHTTTNTQTHVVTKPPACYTANTCNELSFLGRRPLELGNRVFSQEVASLAFRGGFKGYFNMLGNEWDWDANFNYGKNYNTTLTNGLVNTERLQTALGAANLDGTNTAPCTINGQPAPGCVPFNIFGGYNLATGQGSITPAMARYVLYESHDVIAEVMRDYTANISGELFDMPAGPFGIAFGVESLEHDAFSHPDALTQEGNSSGNQTQSANGREATKAEYVEFNIPLVTDAPLMKDVSLDVAERWSQFKWEGGNFGAAGAGVQHSAANASGRAALRWQVDDSLLLRGSWSQGFRIPSVSEFFLGNSDNFPGLSDPCAGPASPNKPTGCSAGTVIQPNGQIRTTVGGNASLTPERSLSRTVGFVYNPSSLPGFDFSLDYYKIELESAVSTIGGQTILNGCYSGNTGYCLLITRGGGPRGNSGSSGDVSNVLDTNINIGGLKVEGVDLGTHYKFPSSSVGDLKAGLEWSFTKQYVVTQPFGSGALSSQDLAGTTTFIGATGSGTTVGGTPKQRGNINLAWNSGAWSATWAMEYIGQMTEDCNGTYTFFGVSPNNAPGFVKTLVKNRCTGQPTGGTPGSFPFDSNAKVPTNHLGATTYHDVSATYHADGINTDFTFGIRNLFDKQPPISMSAFANSFLPTFYRAPGRFFYGRVGVKF